MAHVLNMMKEADYPLGQATQGFIFASTPPTDRAKS